MLAGCTRTVIATWPSLATLLRQNFGIAVQPAHASPVSAFQRDPVGCARDPASRSSITSLRCSMPSPVTAETRTDGVQHRSARFCVCVACLRIQAVDLVPDLDQPRLDRPRCQVRRGLGNVVRLRFAVAVRYIAHVQDQVSLDHLLQRRPERGDQGCRQVGYEANRIRENDALAVRAVRQPAMSDRGSQTAYRPTSRSPRSCG